MTVMKCVSYALLLGSHINAIIQGKTHNQQVVRLPRCKWALLVLTKKNSPPFNGRRSARWKFIYKNE